LLLLPQRVFVTVFVQNTFESGAQQAIVTLDLRAVFRCKIPRPETLFAKQKLAVRAFGLHVNLMAPQTHGTISASSSRFLMWTVAFKIKMANFAGAI
jgi:hypothetical protein